MESENTTDQVMDQVDILITPLKNTQPLEVVSKSSEQFDIASKQLDSLTKLDRKIKRKPTSASDTESKLFPLPPVAEGGTKHNLTSAIVSKAELENEIRKKVTMQESSETFGTIEFPQDLIQGGLESKKDSTSWFEHNIQVSSDSAPQLHDQELIDILEGKSSDETQVFQLVEDNGQMIFVKDSAETEGSSSYGAVSDDDFSQTKAKLLEREIAMRQIASLPVRKNKKSVQTATSSKPTHQSVVQSLAADWTDDDKEDEMILEVMNMEDLKGEPQIKILNMTILNEAPEAKPKMAQLPMKTEPKILNKNAPKKPPVILNINAPAAEKPPATFKRSRIIKKKEIWDPSETKVSVEKDLEKIPLTLPPSITIKKLTKESISKAKPPAEIKTEKSETAETTQKPNAKRVKKRSEIDKLLQDEGAVNMIYSLQRENNNQDVEEDSTPNDKSMTELSQEKSSVVKNVVMKQSSSPPDAKPTGRARSGAKRDPTPVKTEKEPATKPQKTTSAGRKKKTDNSWDYIYSQAAQATCDDAMIIRRRSNSSYSSSAPSPRRLSVDVNESVETSPSPSKKAKQQNSEAFEFTKPPQKNTKSPADEILSKDFVDELRGKISTVLTKQKEKSAAKPTAKGRKRAAQSTESSATPAKRAGRSIGGEHKHRLVKEGKVAHIIFGQNPFSISLLSEMKSVLNQLETDECDVVLISSSEGFSEGLDYSGLVQNTVDRRKQAASDLVTAVKNFLISLAAFPKILVCGLKGPVSGLAVNMLPLFDVVFADSAATFSLPHANIGSNPEGVSVLQLSGKVKPAIVSRLFYLNETLDAKAAQDYGLITKIISDDFDKEVMSYCTRISGFSSQALESTKFILNEDFLNSIDHSLSKEMKTLQQQWITAECQEKFKAFSKSE